MLTSIGIALMVAMMGVTAPSWAEEAHHQGGIATARSGQILGQPWSESEGALRWRAFASYLESSYSFDSDGHRRRLPNDGRFSSWSLNLFGERALTRRWSASMFLPIQYSRLSSSSSHAAWTSLGDVYGWARYRLDDLKGLLPALAAGVKIPGTYQTASGIGDGQADFELQGYLTKVFARGGYAAVNTGYRYRVASPSDELPFGLQVGWPATRRLLIVPSLSGTKGVGGGTRKDFLGAGMSGFWSLQGPWNLFASYQKMVLGTNTAAADIGSVGVSFR